MTRDLRCTRCGALVRVTETPREFIDPRLYTCDQCQQPGQPQTQLNLTCQPRHETRHYDPHTAAIPY